MNILSKVLLVLSFLFNVYPTYTTLESTSLHISGRNIKERQNIGKRMEKFIDENKALIRRMFGEYHAPDDELNPDAARDHFPSVSTGSSSSSNNNSSSGQAIQKRPKRAKNSYTSNKIDSCESAVEIVTPYWASNSAGKIRAIVNTQHLQQAIQQEVCQSVQTKRCNDDCSCEQKYKWHRLLAYDPDDDCKGIFMDWFLFPSCCVCRCSVL